MHCAHENILQNVSTKRICKDKELKKVNKSLGKLTNYNRLNIHLTLFVGILDTSMGGDFGIKFWFNIGKRSTLQTLQHLNVLLL
jgi:hypothetical protein